MNWNTEVIEWKYIVEHFLDHLQVTKVRAKIYSKQITQHNMHYC